MILPTLLTLLPMLVIAAPAALPSDTFTISPSANSTLCMTYEPLSAYHGDSSGGTINLLTCLPPSSTYSPAQHWSIPPVGQTSGGAIRYGGPDGRMCLMVDDVPRDGAKLKLWWCLGLPEQKWVMRKDGMIQLEGYNACLDVRKESERVRLTKGPFGEREKELQVWNCMDGSEQQTFTVTAQ